MSSQKPINRKRSKDKLGLLKVFKFGKSKKSEDENLKQKKKVAEPQQSRQRRGITVDKMVAMKQKYMDEHQSRGGKYPNEEPEPVYMAQSYPVRRPAERVERPAISHQQPPYPVDYMRATINVNDRQDEEKFKYRQKLPSSRSVQNLQNQINQQRVYDRLAQSQNVPQTSDRRVRKYQMYSSSSQPDKAMDLDDLAFPTTNIHVFDPLTRSQHDPRTSRFVPPNPQVNRQRLDYGPLEPRVFDPRFSSRPSSTVPVRSSSPPRVNSYRSNTPTNSLGYLSHHHHRKPPLPPSSNIHELDDPRSVYRPAETINYGSLGRRPAPRISNSAQV